jgi:hypothetical protein
MSIVPNHNGGHKQQWWTQTTMVDDNLPREKRLDEINHSSRVTNMLIMLLPHFEVEIWLFGYIPLNPTGHHKLMLNEKIWYASTVLQSWYSQLIKHFTLLLSLQTIFYILFPLIELFNKPKKYPYF